MSRWHALVGEYLDECSTGGLAESTLKTLCNPLTIRTTGE